MGTRRFSIILAALFLLFIVAAHGFGPPPVGWWGGPWILPRLFFPLLVIAAIAFLARPRHAWRARYAGPEPAPASSYHGTSPEEILRERFARGEVTRDQYREAMVDMLKDRYVRGELTLEEYEARVNVVMDVARDRKAASDTPQEGPR